MAEELQIAKLRKDAAIPEYMTAGAAGMDLHAAIDEPLTIVPGSWAAVGTGLAMRIPDGYEGQVRPRSGLAYRRGLTVLNAPGTIDSDYRGEVKVLLVNLSKEVTIIRSGDRIAQLVVAPVSRLQTVTVESLEETARGSGGFGSTGIR